jgi:hypothetical protein
LLSREIVSQGIIQAVFQPQAKRRPIVLLRKSRICAHRRPQYYKYSFHAFDFYATKIANRSRTAGEKMTETAKMGVEAEN